MSILKYSKILRYKLSWIFLIIFILNFSFYNFILQEEEEECPSDKPIFKSGKANQFTALLKNMKKKNVLLKIIISKLNG